jgi:hypothetical protein
VKTGVPHTVSASLLDGSVRPEMLLLPTEVSDVLPSSDDPRDQDESGRDLRRGGRGGSEPRERERLEPRDVFVDRVSLPRA